jgi:hypothetical protein
MSKAVLLVGPLCSGKTKLAEKLIELGFLKNKSNFYGIEQSRHLLSDGTMAGELDAWAGFLRQIQSPASNDNAIYEFSGTGRHVYSVSWAMSHAVKENPKVEWLVVYCLVGEKTMLTRFPSKVYNAPCPFELGDPVGSLNYMNGELSKSYNNGREWNASPKLKFDMNVENYDGIAKEVLAFFNK